MMKINEHLFTAAYSSCSCKDVDEQQHPYDDFLDNIKAWHFAVDLG